MTLLKICIALLSMTVVALDLSWEKAELDFDGISPKEEAWRRKVFKQMDKLHFILRQL